MESKNKTVVKSKQILQLFIDHDRLTLNEMTALSGIPKTSLFRMASSLEEMGFLQKDGHGYFLGLSFLQFGQLVAERLDVRQIALPVMKQLQLESGEAANLIIQDGNEAIYIEKVDTLQPVRVYTKIGKRAPLYAGACPRILLAYLSQWEREQYLEHTRLAAVAKGTIRDTDTLIQVLEESRSRGYSISHSELENDTSAVAAPIFNHAGKIAAGLSLAGPSARFDADSLPLLIRMVCKAARDISIQLGWKQR
jgi:DNA-binding IclR family transcriptional regulator